MIHPYFHTEGKCSKAYIPFWKSAYDSHLWTSWAVSSHFIDQFSIFSTEFTSRCSRCGVARKQILHHEVVHDKGCVKDPEPHPYYCAEFTMPESARRLPPAFMA